MKPCGVDQKARIFELDILRIVATLGIALFHYTFRGWAADDFSVVKYPILGSFFKYGYLGLYAFFIMSGFLCAPSLLKKDFFLFWSSRLKRLVPPYWLCVLIIVVCYHFCSCWFCHYSWKQLLGSLLFLNFFCDVKYIDHAHWYIFYLVKFYFLVSLFIFIRSKIDFDVFLCLYIGIFAITEFFLGKLSFLFDRNFFIFFLLGLSFYSLYAKSFSYLRIINLLLGFVFAIFSVQNMRLNMIKHYGHDFSIFIILGFIFLLYLFFLLLSLRPNFGFKIHPVFLVLSACSYPFYLLHHNLGFFLINKLSLYFNKYLLILIVLFVVFVLSYLVYFILSFVEKKTYFIRA